MYKRKFLYINKINKYHYYSYLIYMINNIEIYRVRNNTIQKEYVFVISNGLELLQSEEFKNKVLKK
jgi:hypothetical protein